MGEVIEREIRLFKSWEKDRNALANLSVSHSLKVTGSVTYSSQPLHSTHIQNSLNAMC